jgi:diacylglycerol kinase family enzyme
LRTGENVVMPTDDATEAAAHGRQPRSASTPSRRRRLGSPASLLLVVNSNASGSDRRTDDLLGVLRAGGADVDLVHTRTVADFARLCAHPTGRRLVLVGGDGTIHTAVNLARPPRELALIPAGRANNIARSLGIPLDWEQAAGLASSGEVRPVDLIEARSADRRLLVVEGLSVGFLAQARVRYHGSNSADVVAALRAGGAALAHFHPLAAHVQSLSGEEALHLAQLFVANLPLYEFGLNVAPQADPTDAALDIVGIEAPTRRAVLRMIMDLRRGTHLSRTDVHVWRTDRALIATNGCSPIVADSTDLGFGPVHLRAAVGALRLVRP